MNDQSELKKMESAVVLMSGTNEMQVYAQFLAVRLRHVSDLLITSGDETLRGRAQELRDQLKLLERAQAAEES